MAKRAIGATARAAKSRSKRAPSAPAPCVEARSIVQKGQGTEATRSILRRCRQSYGYGGAPKGGGDVHASARERAKARVAARRAQGQGPVVVAKAEPKAAVAAKAPATKVKAAAPAKAPATQSAKSIAAARHKKQGITKEADRRTALEQYRAARTSLKAPLSDHRRASEFLKGSKAPGKGKIDYERLRTIAGRREARASVVGGRKAEAEAEASYAAFIKGVPAGGGRFAGPEADRLIMAADRLPGDLRAGILSKAVHHASKDAGMVKEGGMPAPARMRQIVDKHGLVHKYEEGARDAAASSFANASQLSPGLRKHTQEVVYVSSRNSHDSYWAKEYGRERFVSAATGGEGKIVVYNGGDLSRRSIAHEMGHNLASAKYGSYTPDARYVAAAKADGNGVSDYGNVRITEDFAEAVAEHQTNRATFRVRHPNRAKYLDEII